MSSKSRALAACRYGDISATSTPERLVSMFCMVSGITVFTYLMGAMSSIVTAISSADLHLQQKRSVRLNHSRDTELVACLSACIQCTQLEAGLTSMRHTHLGVAEVT